MTHVRGTDPSTPGCHTRYKAPLEQWRYPYRRRIHIILYISYSELRAGAEAKSCVKAEVTPFSSAGTPVRCLPGARDPMIFNDRPRRAGPQAALPHLAVEWLQRRWAALLRTGTPRLNMIYIVAGIISKRVAATLLATLLLIYGTTAASQPTTSGRFEYATALNISQNAIGNQLGDYPLIDSNGHPARLSQFRGKPMVLSLIYTSCYQICPMTTRHLAKVVEKARAALGKESFTVVAIGFDSDVDTPAAMRHFALQQGIADADWKLFSIGKKDVAALTGDVGLVYYPSSRGFDHIIQATVIDAEGKVYRQVYGQVFDTPLLVEPLKELLLGRPQPSRTFVSDLFDKIRFFCTTYDPVRDGYFFDYSLFIGLFIGATIILLICIWLVREIRYRHRMAEAAEKSP